MCGQDFQTRDQKKTSWAEQRALLHGSCVCIVKGERELQHPAQNRKMLYLDQQDTNFTLYMAVRRADHCSPEHVPKSLNKGFINVDLQAAQRRTVRKSPQILAQGRFCSNLSGSIFNSFFRIGLG